ncbi:MAG: DUF4147 domain-containing protein [Pseudomonadota bacterium]
MTALLDLWRVGVDAVKGDRAVAAALEAGDIPWPNQIISVGKAAATMAQAAGAHFPNVPILIVTKDGHANGAPPYARVIEAAHPVPDQRSLNAGAALLGTVASMAPGSHLLMLVSGGASALAEALKGSMTLDDLATATQHLLASGADIHAMNARRKELSLIKGGGLLRRFHGVHVTTLAISDVERDALDVIGSGIGDALPSAPFLFTPRIVASNALARAAIEDASLFAILRNQENLYDDVEALAGRLAPMLQKAEPGLSIFGGEPTVILPENPGLGGRNMALALCLAREISGDENLQILVAGTDGTDGPTDAAGALVDGNTWDPTGANALARADAYPWLSAKEALVKTGPTGTNVMDLMLALRS